MFHQSNYQKAIFPLIIILFSIAGMKALLQPGLFTAHDIWHQVVRLYYYFQAVNDGQIPPYWVGQLANNFGYPLFVFSYQLPWIIGVFLLKIGFDIPSTIKTLFFVSYLFSGITMYFFVYSLLKHRSAALLSSVLYMWLPYHFLITFVGASMGIAFVFIFLPMIFWGIHSIQERSKSGVAILALGLSGVILSHIMHVIFLFPAILIFFLWALINAKAKFIFLKNICFGVILAILISSFYLIPAGYYSKFTRVYQETGISEVYKRNFINFNQLIYSKWGYGPIVNNAKNGESSFQLGFAQWISIIFLILLTITKNISKSQKNLSINVIFIYATSVFLMLDYSKFIWGFITKFVTVDFPFRLLLPATFIASLSAGLVLVNIRKNFQIIFFIFIILTAVYTNRNHLNVNQYTNFPISTYLNLETEITTNTFNEYLPLQASGKLLNKPWDAIIGENIFSPNVKQTTNFLSFNLHVRKKTAVSVGQFYFPGQTLYLNNNPTSYNTDKEGRISFVAPQGQYMVTIKYQEPLLIQISKILTLIGVIVIIFRKKLNF